MHIHVYFALFYIFKILDANLRADQIYGPVVERRKRVENVRNTLSILQQYKFFFNLPSSLLESIKQVCIHLLFFI